MTRDDNKYEKLSDQELRKLRDKLLDMEGPRTAVAFWECVAEEERRRKTREEGCKRCPFVANVID